MEENRGDQETSEWSLRLKAKKWRKNATEGRLNENELNDELGNIVKNQWNEAIEGDGEIKDIRSYLLK